MTSEEPVVAGVELGGTKAVLVLARGAEVIEQHTIPTTSPEETLGKSRAQLLQWMNDQPFAALGIAAFGPLDLDPGSPGFGKLFTTPKPGWANFDVAKALTSGLGCPWTIETDVNAAALAELRWGAAQGCGDVCYVTVGTGVGGGLLVNGQAVHGAMHPEIGHLRLRRAPGDDFAGTCPFHGDCTEGLISGTALRARFGRDPASLSDADPRWQLVASDLAELVAAILLMTSVQRVLLGGTVMLSRPHLLSGARGAVLERVGGYLPKVNSGSVEQVVRMAGLGTQAGPLGAIAVGRCALAAIATNS
uniref:ROK family protein n=1 Tax=Altererythrobacter segetis TaxID=1104773 RepID=UPI001A9C5FF7|nr:ROK family protein [Altererythrobacter segetis]